MTLALINGTHHYLLPRCRCFHSEVAVELLSLCLALLIRCPTGSHSAWWVPVGWRLLKDTASIGKEERKRMQAVLLWRMRTRTPPPVFTAVLGRPSGCWFNWVFCLCFPSYLTFPGSFYKVVFCCVLNWMPGAFPDCVVSSLGLGLQSNPFFCQFGTEDWNIMRWCRQSDARKDGQLGD